MALDAKFVKAVANEVGFDLCGITDAQPIQEAEQRLTDWLAAGMQGEMSYMQRDPLRRSRPTEVLSDAKSIIMLGLNYFQASSSAPDTPGQSFGRVSRYARGEDYHEVIEKKQALLIKRIGQKSAIPAAEIKSHFRGYVDYGPVLERSYAVKAGLGYIGKNSMLINRSFGSYFFLSAIITTCALEVDTTEVNHGRCGECRKCIDACPTDAIVEDGVVDARRCISYLTIERPTEIPNDLAERMGEHLFGCDICQEVCPHNGRAIISSHAAFSPNHGAGEWISLNDIDQLSSDEDFKSQFASSPILRTRLAGLKRNGVIVRRNLTRGKRPTS